MKKMLFLFCFHFVLTFGYAQRLNWAITNLPNTVGKTEDLKTDSHNHLYTACTFYNLFDPDGTQQPLPPLPGVGAYDSYIGKYDINGQHEWGFVLGSDGDDFIRAITLDGSDNVYATGNYYDTLDLDPSVAVNNVYPYPGTFAYQVFVAKYDSLGNYAWAMNIGDSTTHDIEVQSMSLLSNDNIVISANPNGVLDVDPSNAVHNSIGNNANIICYDNNGNYIWNNHISPLYTYGVPVKSIATDAIGNSYLLSVGYYELTVNKFDNNGVYLWSKKIGNFSSGARVDPQTILVNNTTSEFYIAGTFDDTVDFDPGIGVVERISTSGSYQDGFIAKYDQDMNLIWVNAYEGEVSFGSNSLDFNNSDIVAVGDLRGTIDFGNGQIYTSPTLLNPFYILLDTSGTAQSGFSLNGYGKFFAVNTTINQSVVMIGNINSTTDMDPGAPVYLLNITSSSFFTAVYHTTLPTITSEHAKNLMIEVSPNPSKNSFNIKVDASLIGSNYKCFDYTGKMITEGKIESLYTDIQLEGSAAGIYFLKLDGKTTETLKLIKS